MAAGNTWCHLALDKDEACDQANQILPPRIYYCETDQNDSNRTQTGNKQLVLTGRLIKQWHDESLQWFLQLNPTDLFRFLCSSESNILDFSLILAPGSTNPFVESIIHRTRYEELERQRLSVAWWSCCPALDVDLPRITEMSEEAALTLSRRNLTLELSITSQGRNMWDELTKPTLEINSKQTPVNSQMMQRDGPISARCCGGLRAQPASPLWSTLRPRDVGFEPR
ncbi:hypothetical protein MJG53_004319 [Ovis ammon polii x Ovis aries]|uniref:Uncharacterized protein n=1 Tax=Ovis ammon polii x Ovis aries TaxID=2918886 RepID=A0ACB9V9G2_9CETA|nr:hypothetical protein MJG53_004319 [Ovis ammon polii x Ovis aries]